MRLFANRKEAGEILAKRLLSERKWEGALVLALPRGGVPIGREVADELGLPLDVLLVKKIGAPNQSEFAIGAMPEDEQPIWDQSSISQLDLSEKDLQEAAEISRRKILDQAIKWRHEPLKIKSKTVIVVDDGLATGLTMVAAVQFLKRQKVSKIIIAVPVASSSSMDSLKPLVDEIVALQIPEPFFSVGQWYKDFTQVTDEMVTDLLDKKTNDEQTTTIKIPLKLGELVGNLSIPKYPKGVIIFAHGSGSTHQSPRNRLVATALNRLGFATLLFDLLTPAEALDRRNVFDIELLSKRLVTATSWISKHSSLKKLPIGYFGASTGAAAALSAAAHEKNIYSVVSRGGRPDLAYGKLSQVQCPTLLIVGSEDGDVIKLNEKAKAQLKNCELAIVPKAGHLFEEPGTLDEVIEYAKSWFSKTLHKNVTTKPSAKHPQEPIFSEIKNLAHPLKSEKNLEPLLQKLSNARIVMLGEATHGTEEFYELRKIISQKLIEDFGFNFIAVEGDWPDCYKLSQYINSIGSSHATDVMKSFKRWPTWMWANEQVADLIEWMKMYDVGFYGLDVYSLYESLDLVKTYTRKLTPGLAARVLEAYSCLDSFDRDEIAYARSLLKWPAGCEQEILQNLRDILRLRLDNTLLDEGELFDLKQNAKIIRNAEQYYRAMLTGGPESWNIRDQHMMDTLDALLLHHGEGSKAIVWAHNTHIGDYHATDMITDGYVNLGGLARERYGMDKVFLVGFGTNEGKVLAGRAWGAKPEVMNLAPAPSGTYENYFHQVSQKLKTDKLYVLMEGEQSSLALRKGHRAVGVVYQPIFEPAGKNYVPTELANRYDAFIFIDKTTALKAIPSTAGKGMLPETWPVGI